MSTQDKTILNSDQETYRDKISTVDSSGKRVWIYPKKPKGRFYEYRKYVSYVLLVILFGLPFISYDDRPFVLFNVLETEFIILGIYFAPQDFYLFVIAMLIGIIFIALFTVIYGRLFCGWVCPQTIFMEMVFRRIEYWIEGDANAQKRLNKSEWTADKIWKKTLKQSIFILISVLIAHTFLSYVIGIKEVWQIITDPIGDHLGGFTAMVIFTALFYGVFSVMREQVCTTICPYGRLQGVLLDEDSLAVTYDFQRGEPRGKLVKPRKGKKSDCADGCNTCKSGGSTCPSDALKVMFQDLEPESPNLIRIDSYNGVIEKKKSIFTPRVIAYSLVLVALMGLESFLFLSRSDVETLLLRTPGRQKQQRTALQKVQYLSKSLKTS